MRADERTVVSAEGCSLMPRRLIDQNFVLGFVSVFVLIVILFGVALLLIG